MYICDFCNKQVGPGIPSNTIVMETREKEYPARPSVNDPGGFGYEIVKEAKVCTDCIPGE